MSIRKQEGAMIKITNGKTVLMVTSSAFNQVYASQGFEIYKENRSKKVVDLPRQESNNIAEISKKVESVPIDDGSEKPLSEMNRNEVPKYAEKHGIDISGAKNLKAAKAIIRKALDEVN